MRFIPTRFHAPLDYVAGAALIAAPRSSSFPGTPEPPSRPGLMRRRYTRPAVSDPKPALLVAVNFQSVPLPEVAAVLERLSAAGWEWQGNRKNWTAAFRKEFERAGGARAGKDADRATDEIRELMGDYFMDGRGAG
jgi:hypothetical protein